MPRECPSIFILALKSQNFKTHFTIHLLSQFCFGTFQNNSSLFSPTSFFLCLSYTITYSPSPSLFLYLSYSITYSPSLRLTHTRTLQPSLSLSLSLSIFPFFTFSLPHTLILSLTHKKLRQKSFFKPCKT